MTAALNGNAEGLTAGEYSATITFDNFTNGNGSFTGSASLSIMQLSHLSVDVVPAEFGTVTVDPSKANYVQGELVTLTATPAAGHTFSGWSGDASGTTNPLTLILDGDKAVTANFAAFLGALSVDCSGALNPSGAPGGPFAPSSITCTLGNPGGTSIDWAGPATQNWLTLSATSGTLAAGTSTTVTVSVNSNAEGLGEGVHSATITFDNLTNGNGNFYSEASLTIARRLGKQCRTNL